MASPELHSNRGHARENGFDPESSPNGQHATNDTVEDESFVPKISSDSPSGRSASTLNKLLVPRANTGHETSIWMKWSTHSLEKRPVPGVADKLVEDMVRKEEDYQNRVQESVPDEEQIDNWWSDLPFDENQWTERQKRQHLPQRIKPWVPPTKRPVGSTASSTQFTERRWNGRTLLGQDGNWQEKLE